LNRAELIARLNALGEGRRALILQRNDLNEEEKLQRTYARDSPAYAASFERGHQMRENEQRLAQQIRAALTPRGMTPGNVGYRAGIATPPHLLRPFAPGTPGSLPPLGELPPPWQAHLEVPPQTPRIVFT
jgi:hypothetical protein